MPTKKKKPARKRKGFKEMMRSVKECKTCVVKRGGHTEEFDERKVYGAVYFSCMNCHYTEQQAEKVAELVTKAVKAFVFKKKELSSKELFHFIIKELKKHDPEASFMYETHRIIS